MCVCNPSIKTPWCGRPGCERPVAEPNPAEDFRRALLGELRTLVSEIEGRQIPSNVDLHEMIERHVRKSMDGGRL